MEELNFNPHKSAAEFRKNYRLHDLAENIGKNLLIQWGIRFEDFGSDKRFEKVWEKGLDKPDLIITYRGKKALLDWKAKHKSVWRINKRAFDSYLEWEKKLNIPVLVAFTVFSESDELAEMRFACLNFHSYKINERKEWDKNSTIEFEQILPVFSKGALLHLLR